MPEFTYTDLLPTGADGTTYRRLTSDGVRNHGSFGRNFLEVEPQLLTLLTAVGCVATIPAHGHFTAGEAAVTIVVLCALTLLAVVSAVGARRQWRLASSS